MTPVAALLLIMIELVSGINVSREYFGVVFTPYVKKPVNGIQVSRSDYTIQEMIVMMQVVKTKFSLLTTYGVGAVNPGGKKVENNALILTPEAAVRVNENSTSNFLRLFVGTWRGNSLPLFETAIQHAFEASELANQRHRGTVKGIIFSSNFIKTNADAASIKQIIASYKSRAKENHLQVGFRSDRCGDFEAGNTSTAYGLLQNCDFIICTYYLSDGVYKSGPQRGSDVVIRIFGDWKLWIKRANPKVQIYFETGWASKGNPWHNVENMKQYWETLNEWAESSKSHVFMGDAFDNPVNMWSASAPYQGWWRLRSNDKFTVDGFAEKIVEPEPDEKENKNSNKSGLIVGLSTGIPLAIILLLILGTLLIVMKRQSKLKAILTDMEIAEFKEGVRNDNEVDRNMVSALRLPYDMSFELAKDDFTIDESQILGSGAFGQVIKGTIKNREGQVALKTTKKACPSTAFRGMLTEIKILIYLGEHKNIVSIIGAYTAEIKRGIVYIAYELCALGCLETNLRSRKLDYANVANNAPSVNCDIGFIDQLKWAYEIAAGMEYITSKNVIHADLATRNVLLSADRTAKITDFGLSRRLYEYTNYVKTQQEPLPWRWMSIEALRRLEFSVKSDVWSYGVTLWEIFTFGDLPYAGLSWSVDFTEELINGLRLPNPRTSDAIYEKMKMAWNLSPELRPGFTEYKNFFAELLWKEESLQTM